MDKIDRKPTETKKVVVIGAGAAGLGAARWLCENDLSGILEVSVLEARNRIGGRVYTDTDYDVPVDLGASWLHDHEEGNPISIMAARLNLDIRNTEWDNSISLNSQGERLNEKIAARYWTVLEAAFCDSVKPTLNPLAARESQSLEALIKGCVGKTTWNDPLFQSWVCDFDFEFGASLKNVSAYAVDSGWIDAVSSEADDYNMSFPGAGYGAIMEGLVSGVATDNVRMRNTVGSGSDGNSSTPRALDVSLGRRVVSVDTTGESGWKCMLTIVEEAEASNGNVEKIPADAVICTVPIGVLKASSIAFQPPLSDRKLDAIRRIGAGNAVKVVMEFRTVFWPESSELMHIADVEFCSDFAANPAESQSRGLLTHFWNFFNVCGKKKKILIGFALGDAANTVDAMSDSELEDVIISRMKSLSKDHVFAPGEEELALTPLRWKRTQWAKDPYTRCTYSYVPVGETDTTICAELGRRESEALWFAGEACHVSSELRSCVGGAWLSGIAAAEGLTRALGLSVTTPGAASFTAEKHKGREAAQ